MKITKTFFKTEIEVSPLELVDLKITDYGIYVKIKDFIKKVLNK